MRTLITALLTVLSLSACRADEMAYGGPDRIWTLKQLNGATFPAAATLTFPKEGEIVGQGPCNRYFGAMTAPYPQFDAGPIGSTRMACPDMAAETAFLAALDAATQASVLDDTLTLSNADGIEMVFKSTE